MQTREPDTSPDFSDVDPSLLEGALLLMQHGEGSSSSLLDALVVAHTFSKLRDRAACDEASRKLLERLREAGLVEDMEGASSLSAAGGELLERLARGREELRRALPGRIRNVLVEVVDRDQARMFADRAASLLRLLERLAEERSTGAESRVLEVVLVRRAVALLDGPAEARALAVRSLIDFVYTRAVMLRHRSAGAGRRRRIRAEDILWHTVRRGIAGARLELRLRRGPLLVHLFRVDPRKAVLRAVDASRLPDRERTLERICAAQGAYEGTSGGFFLYSEHDIEPPQQRGDPVGLLVADGVVRTPPLFDRGALLVDEQGHVFIRRVPLRGTRLSWSGGQLNLRAVNRPRQRAEEVVAYTRACGPLTPASSDRTVTIVGGKVTAVGEGATPVPLLGLVLSFPPAQIVESLLATLPIGAPVEYSLPTVPGEAAIRDAMAGGPILVDEGQVAVDLEREEFLPGVPPATFGGDATVGLNLLPRLAWGVRTDHHLVAAAVDGRNVSASLGETLEGMAHLMRVAGCRAALNYDGGASKRMCIDRHVVDLATPDLVDEGPVRPAPPRLLSSAWVVVPRKPGPGPQPARDRKRRR